MPFVRSAHVEACLRERPNVAVMFYGFDAALVRRLQHAGITVWHQVGTIEQAQRALADGVDGLIAQRSEERRVGKECVSTCRYRWSPAHKTKKAQIKRSRLADKAESRIEKKD